MNEKDLASKYLEQIEHMLLRVTLDDEPIDKIKLIGMLRAIYFLLQEYVGGK